MAKINENYFIKDSDPNKKDSIDSMIMKDENVLLRLKPNKKAYIMESFFNGLPFALLWLTFDVFIIVMTVQFWTLDAARLGFVLVFMVLFFLIHLAPVWIFIAHIVKRVASLKNIEYAITDKRILIRSGVIGVDFKSIYYSEISGVNVKVSPTDKLFKVGDIYITASTQSAVLDDLKDPYFLMDRIHQITLDIKTDIQFPNDFRPTENHGYYTKYKDENNE
ncbi:MAG: PH domain-containing protein [Bacilli bacterium]|nr:PH domain-containing protein [Bacilli bacterium]